MIEIKTKRAIGATTRLLEYFKVYGFFSKACFIVNSKTQKNIVQQRCNLRGYENKILTVEEFHVSIKSGVRYELVLMDEGIPLIEVFRVIAWCDNHEVAYKAIIGDYEAEQPKLCVHKWSEKQYARIAMGTDLIEIGNVCEKCREFKVEKNVKKVPLKGVGL